MEFYTLASGSAGNAALVREGDTCLLIDAGISSKRICSSLSELGISPQNIHGILLTHSHSDHIGGLTVFAKRCSAPIYGTAETLRSLSIAEERLFPIVSEIPFWIGEMQILPFATSHDTPDSVGFRVDSRLGSLGYLTDTGYVTPVATRLLLGTDLVLLEANHDVNVLLAGSYPYSLKRRILSNLGHLSNVDAGRFAVALAQHGAEQIILAHLSPENNTPDLALQTVQSALDAASCTARLTVAPQTARSERFVVCKKSTCFVSEN